VATTQRQRQPADYRSRAVAWLVLALAVIAVLSVIAGYTNGG
jgi:hypothetical protein